MSAAGTETGLAGKTAIVTGAASGIGRAVSNALLGLGAAVVGIDIDEAALAGLNEHPSFHGIHADVADASSAGAAVNRAADLGGGRVDILVNDAGIGFVATVTETTDDQWERTFDVNCRGPFLMCRAVIPLMLSAGGGVIVNVASSVALKAVPSRAAYCASKAALIGLTQAISVDYAARGIRANVVAPGVVDTPWVARVTAAAADPDASRARMADRQLVGRMAAPSEIADAIVYLASDRASFIHGATMVVDGGFLLR